MTNIQNKYGGDWNEKYLLFFGIALTTFFLISNVMSVKFFEIYGFKFGAAALFIPFCLVIGDIVTEVYGFKKASQVIVAALIARICFGISAWFVVMLPPAAEWKFQPEVEIVFGQMSRNAIAGCVAYLASELLNSYIMSRMKIWSNGKNFALRAMVSTIAAELVHTAIFQTVAFGGVMPVGFLIQVVINATILKTAIEALVLPLTSVLVVKVKKLEGIEYFDERPVRVV
jgi:uncharacterized integral membrane protein (TIGR00697 family)